MKKAIVCLIVIGFVFTGCTGSFNLTKNIYKIHRSQEKWMDEAIFLAFVIFPVYGIGTLCDGLLFNTIEFWTGNNPIDLSMTDSPDEKIFMERTARGVVAKNKIGSVLYSSIKDPEGGVSVYDGDDRLVRYFSPEEVQSNRSQFSSN